MNLILFMMVFLFSADAHRIHKRAGNLNMICGEDEKYVNFDNAFLFIIVRRDDVKYLVLHFRW